MEEVINHAGKEKGRCTMTPKEAESLLHVDERVRDLVLAIDSMPGIRTLMSCGGHKNPKVTKSQVPENEFFVIFNFRTKYPGKPAWRSLNKIARLAIDPGIYAWTWKKDHFVKISVIRNDNIPFFQLHGRNVDPVDLVEELYTMKPEDFDKLKMEDPDSIRVIPNGGLWRDPRYLETMKELQVKIEQ